MTKVVKKEGLSGGERLVTVGVGVAVGLGLTAAVRIAPESALFAGCFVVGAGAKALGVGGFISERVRGRQLANSRQTRPSRPRSG